MQIHGREHGLVCKVDIGWTHTHAADPLHFRTTPVASVRDRVHWDQTATFTIARAGGGTCTLTVLEQAIRRAGAPLLLPRAISHAPHAAHSLSCVLLCANLRCPKRHDVRRRAGRSMSTMTQTP